MTTFLFLTLPEKDNKALICTFEAKENSTDMTRIEIPHTKPLPPSSLAKDIRVACLLSQALLPITRRRQNLLQHFDGIDCRWRRRLLRGGTAKKCFPLQKMPRLRYFSYRSLCRISKLLLSAQTLVCIGGILGRANIDIISKCCVFFPKLVLLY